MNTPSDTSTRLSAPCPLCEAEVPAPADVAQGEILVCDDCGAELEAVDTRPLKFEEAPEVQEDWGE